MSTSFRHLPRLSVIALIAVFVLSAGAGFAVSNSPEWTRAELNIVIGVNAMHADYLNVLAHAIDIALGPACAAVLLAAVVVIVGFVGRSAAAAVRCGVLVVVPWVVADMVKIIVRRPRLDGTALPFPSGVDPSTFSYPSGHTAIAVALGSAAIILTSGKVRQAAIVIAIVLVVVTGWSRIYLGAHYPSDVVASIVLVPAATWAVFEILQLFPRLAARPRVVASRIVV